MSLPHQGSSADRVRAWVPQAVALVGDGGASPRMASAVRGMQQDIALMSQELDELREALRASKRREIVVQGIRSELAETQCNLERASRDLDAERAHKPRCTGSECSVLFSSPSEQSMPAEGSHAGELSHHEEEGTGESQGGDQLRGQIRELRQQLDDHREVLSDRCRAEPLFARATAAELDLKALRRENSACRAELREAKYGLPALERAVAAEAELVVLRRATAHLRAQLREERFGAPRQDRASAAEIDLLVCRRANSELRAELREARFYQQQPVPPSASPPAAQPWRGHFETPPNVRHSSTFPRERESREARHAQEELANKAAEMAAAAASDAEEGPWMAWAKCMGVATLLLVLLWAVTVRLVAAGFVLVATPEVDASRVAFVGGPRDL